MDAIIEKEFYKRLEQGRLYTGKARTEDALHIWKMSWHACQNWNDNVREKEEDYADDLSDIEALVTGGN